MTSCFWESKEAALKASDSKLIPYKVNKNGQYTYEVPLSGLNKDIKLAARSHRYYEAGEKDKMWYDHTLKFTADTGNSGNATPTPTPTRGSSLRHRRQVRLQLRLQAVEAEQVVEAIPEAEAAPAVILQVETIIIPRRQTARPAR